MTKGTSWREIVHLIKGVGGRMKVSQGNKGNEHGWKKWHTNLARSGTWELTGGT